MNVKHELMGKENLTKLLLKFSLPAMIGLVVNALYNIIDRIYIGRIPETASLDIGSVGITLPMTTISFAIALMIGMGGATLVSLKLGEKRKELSEKYLGNAVILGAFLAILFCIMTIIYMRPLLFILGASENTFQGAKDYLSIIAYGYIFNIVGYIANASIRADGNPKMSMYTLLIGAILNIILDPIFIFTFKMGIKGAAIATVISQLASMVWALSYFMKKNSKSGIKLHGENLKVNLQYMGEIIKQGLAPFFLQLGSGIVILILNLMLKKTTGDLGVSAMTIVQGIVMFFVMPIFAINQAVLPIAGYNYGAKNYARVKGVLLRAVVGATLVGLIGLITIQLASKYFVLAFTTDPELISIATKGLRINTIAFPLVGSQIVSSIYFQAIGKPKMTMLLTLSRQILLLIPIAIILGTMHGGKGVWIAAPIADTISFTITSIMLRIELKHLKELENQE